MRRDAIRRLRPAHDAAGALCRGPKISRQGSCQGEEERRQGQTALLLPHQRKRTTGSRVVMWHLSEAHAPAPQRGKPGAAPKPKSREAAWGGPGPDADAGPPTCVSDDESDRRSKSPACIERAQHDAVPRTPPPPPPPPVCAGSPASRVAASYKRLAALRVNDDDPPPPRRRAHSLDDEYDPRRAVPKYRVSERRRENTLRDSLLPERPAPNADDGFMLGLMTAIGCGTISCGCGEEDIS